MSTELTTTQKLTAKNKVFLEYLLTGLSVLDAYRKAGYSGGYTAAYELKSKLNPVLNELVNTRSTLHDTLNEIELLDSMPLHEQKITLNQKIRLISLKLKALQHVSENNKPQPKLTAFVINRSEDKTTVNIGEVQEAEIVKADEASGHSDLGQSDKK